MNIFMSFAGRVKSAGVSFQLVVTLVVLLTGALLSVSCNDRIVPPVTQETLRGQTLQYFDINGFRATVRYDGDFNSGEAGAGTVWPRSNPVPAIYNMGLWIAGNLGGSLRVTASFYGSEFVPGKIGVIPSAGVFKLLRSQASGADSTVWPVDLGAPQTPDGRPLVYGDETLWTAYCDTEQTSHFRFQTMPLYVDVAQWVFGYTSAGTPANTMFLRFDIINRNQTPIEGACVGFFADVDLGNPRDDLVGWSSTAECGFTYNTPSDSSWAGAPPALGVYFLKTPMESGFPRTTSFLGYTSSLDPGSASEAYNMLKGSMPDGTPVRDPVAERTTTFMYPGDPVSRTGWLDAVPGDKRVLLSSGPFTLQPNQAQTLLVGITMAQGTNPVNSVSELLRAVQTIRITRTLWDF